MWFFEVEQLLGEGKAVKRLAWPEKDSLRKVTETVDLSDLDLSGFGVPASLNVDVAKGTLVYCTDKDASIGYVLTDEDKRSQDWEAA